MGNWLKLGIPVVLVSFVILFFSPQLIFADSEKEHLIALKSIKKISTDLSDFAVIEFRVINFLNDDLDFSKKNLAYLKNTAGKFFPTSFTNQLKAKFDIECSDTGKLVSSGLTKEILLCFEVPKDDNEDYLLVVDKDKTILDKPKEIQVYLNSHIIYPKFEFFDFSKVFFTIHDVKTKSIPGYHLLMVELTAYNGYAPLNKYGEVTPAPVPLEGKKFFVNDMKGNSFTALSTQYSNTGYDEYCPKTRDLMSNQYGNFVYCFNIQKAPQKNTEYWLVLNEATTAFFCSENCQEKKWSLAPYISSSAEPEPIAEPSSITKAQKIPDWVRNIFVWYGEGQIGEDDLIGALQFLIKEGIIKV